MIATNSLVQTVFKNEMTEAGLKELREKYPADIVHDMSDEEQFKSARKVRTERNKLVESIDRKRKDFNEEVKQYADELINEVNGIYSGIVDAFEIEDKRRKEEAARLKRIEEEKIQKSRDEVQALRSMIDQCHGKDSGYIEGMIESADLIEVDCFHKEVIHEAIEMKKHVMTALTQLLSDTKAREKLAAEQEAIDEERRKLDAERAEFEAWKRSQKQEVAEQVIQEEPEQSPEPYLQKPSDKAKSNPPARGSIEDLQERFGEKVVSFDGSSVVLEGSFNAAELLSLSRLMAGEL